MLKLGMEIQVREGSSFCTIGNQIYMVGGKHHRSIFCNVYDTDFNRWLDPSTIPIMPEKRHGCAAVSAGSNLYVMGGYNRASSYLNKVIVYNTTATSTATATATAQHSHITEISFQPKESRKRNFSQSFMENEDDDDYNYHDKTQVKREEESSSYEDHQHFNNHTIQMDHSRMLLNDVANSNNTNNDDDDDMKAPSAIDRVNHLEEGLGSRVDSFNSLKSRIEHLEFNILGDDAQGSSGFPILKRIEILEEAFYC